MCCLSPSESIDKIAQEHLHELPRSPRLSAVNRRYSTWRRPAASYLLFEQGFCRKLIELGVRDAEAKAEQIKQFFAADIQ